MTKIGRPTWHSNMIALVKANGSKAITGDLLQAILTDLGDSSAFLITEDSVIGLKPFDPLAIYKLGQGMIKDGIIYQSKIDNNTGAFVADNWNSITQPIGALNDYDEYDNAHPYVSGNKVTYLFKLYKAKVDTEGNLPTDTSFWSEVSGDTGIVDWQTGTDYLEGRYLRQSGLLFVVKTSHTSGTFSADLTANKLEKLSYVTLVGDNTLTGYLTLNADPVNAMHAATKQWVTAQITALIASAPGAMDTLNELAAALGDDPDFSTTILNMINAESIDAGTVTTEYDVTFDRRRYIKMILSGSVNFALDTTNAKVMQPLVIEVTGTEPSFDSAFQKIGGTWSEDETNYIRLQYLSSTKVHYEIYQI